MSNDTNQKINDTTDKLKDLYKRKSQSAKDMFKSMQGYLSEYISDKTEDQKPVWDTVKESIQVDGVANIPRNMALLFKTYKFGPLSGFKRMYIVLLIDLILSVLLFNGLNGFFYTGLRTLFGLCAPFVTTLLFMIIFYVPISGLVNNLIALFRSYFFLHYNLDEEHCLVDELKVADNKLLKRIDPYYRLDPYNLDDSVIVVSDKDAKKKTISEEYRGYIDYEDEPKEEPEVVRPEKNNEDDSLDWAKSYIQNNEEHPDTVIVRDAAPAPSGQDLNVFELLANTKETDRTLDSVLNNLGEKDYESESDQEIFSGVDFDELREVKEERQNDDSPLRDRLIDKHQIKIRKELRKKAKEKPVDMSAIDQFNEFM